jgi:hypothetical protein
MSRQAKNLPRQLKGFQMKKLILTLAALGLAMGVQAQTYSAFTLTSGFPSNMAANTDTNLASSVVFDVKKQKDAAVELRWIGMDTGSNGVISFVFARSVDGNTFESLAAKRTLVRIASTGAAKAKP